MRTVLIWAVTAFVAISAQKVSTNGRCGPDFGNRVCKGSSYGDCCSQYGWCGSTSGHCGTGCQSNFGTCSGSGVTSTIRSSTLRTSTIPNTRSSSIAPSSTRTSATAIASPSIQVSENGRCGYSNGATGGFTCKGSTYGDCCSQYSYCGSTSAYCGTGCQSGFGTCSGISSSVRSSSTSSVRSSSTSSVRSSSTSSVRSSSSSSVRSSSSSSVRSSSASSSAQSSTASSSTAPVPSSTQVSSSVSTEASSSASSSIAVSSSAVASLSSISSSVSATSSSATTSSVTSSLASESPSLISSVTTTVSSQTTTSVVSTQSSSTPTVTSPVQIVVNPSFELGDGLDPTDWTVQRLYIIDAANTGRVQSNPHTGAYSIRGRGMPNGGYDVYLSQDVTVVPGASYTIEVFAKQTTDGRCSISIYLNDQAIREFAPPGTSYTSITAVVNIAAGDPVQQTLLIDGACSLPDGSPEMYDLFIDDVTMTLVV